MKGLLGFTRHVRNKNVKMHIKMKRGVGPFGKKSGFKMEDFYLRALFFSRSRQQFVIDHMVSQILEPTPCSLDRYVTRRFHIKFSIE